ncbi:MAG: DUF1287 domain-containing protein, partial [Lachnospiraceae bacterium]|nr:DUF1287 domain-containing protein [Lachnospiraceae bacterium]
WRAFRNAGYSLRDMVDRDIMLYPEDYPRVSKRDNNIDFRRVVNLRVFFDKYATEITIYANNRTGLLVDLSKVFTERGIDLSGINSRVSKQGTATLSVTFEISGTDELNKIIEKIRQIDSVIDIERSAT